MDGDTESVVKGPNGECEALNAGEVQTGSTITLARSWQAPIGDSDHSNAADLNNDGRVDIFDVILVGRSQQTDAGGAS